MDIISQTIDFFLPRTCISCQSKLKKTEKYICNTCLAAIKRTDKEFLKNEFLRKFETEKIISDFYSLFVFEKDKALQTVIHDLKYNGNIKVGHYLGKLLGEYFYQEIKNWKAELIIPVPLFHLKKAERGYNQSYYISKGLSEITSISVSERALKRNRYTISQTELNLEERKENVKGAFTVKNKDLIVDKVIILVDDVITTGATISECGKVLKLNGASNVFALSIAIAQ